MRWIKNENQNIKLKFKVYFTKEVIELQDATEFLNSNCINELLLYELPLLLSQAVCQNLTFLNISNSRSIIFG
jgi:hypothetical protein